ncbi:MAG: hypothetical protein AABW51_02090 [Nanoarchaeota archaeon]
MKKTNEVLSKADKKGQAAMEFLMTYGWAILAAVIVVGVLWYLIGNPANLAGDRFQLSAPLVANAMSLTSLPVGTGSVTIEFRNGQSQTITVTSIDFPDKSICSNSSMSVPIAAGNLTSFTLGCVSPGLLTGDRFNSGVTIKYTVSGSSVTQQSTGSISGKIP